MAKGSLLSKLDKVNSLLDSTQSAESSVVMQALNRHVVRVFNPDREDPHRPHELTDALNTR
jgi:hypothetical protein